MFTVSNKTPKAYETSRPGTGAMALLMKALGGLGENAEGISRSAGTSVAEDRLAAMTPEERQSKTLLDNFQGLNLTDNFRKRLEGQEADAVKESQLQDQRDFTRERDETLHGYNMARDKAKPRTGTGGSGTPKVDAQQVRENELALPSLDKIITDNETAIAANDTQDGIGLGQKEQILEQARRAKYRLLQENGMTEKAARDAVYKQSPTMKALMKRISGNVYKEK